MSDLVNNSGIEPVEYKVLVLPKQVEKKTAGGIILAEETISKEGFAQQEGVLIAVSADAFTHPAWLRSPRVGDTVLFDRYAGFNLEGTDGEKYRLINDKEIGAILHKGGKDG